MMSCCCNPFQSNAPLTFTTVPSNHFKLKREWIDLPGRKKVKNVCTLFGCAVVHRRRAARQISLSSSWRTPLQQAGARGEANLVNLNSVNSVQAAQNLCRKSTFAGGCVQFPSRFAEVAAKTLAQVGRECLQPAWPASSHLKAHLLPNFDSKARKQRLTLPVVCFSSLLPHPFLPPNHRCPHRPYVPTASQLSHNHTDYCNQKPPTRPPFSSVWRELGSFHQRPSSAMMC